MTAPPVRTVRAALLAGLAGLAAPYLAALTWALLSSAVWGAGWRVAAFLDPAASRPAGYLAVSLLFTAALGAVLGAALARTLAGHGTGAGWGLWAAFGAGVVLSAAALNPLLLRQPVLLLLIVSSALGFRLGARR